MCYVGSLTETLIGNTSSDNRGANLLKLRKNASSAVQMAGTLGRLNADSMRINGGLRRRRQISQVLTFSEVRFVRRGRYLLRSVLD